MQRARDVNFTLMPVKKALLNWAIVQSFPLEYRAFTLQATCKYWKQMCFFLISFPHKKILIFKSSLQYKEIKTYIVFGKTVTFHFHSSDYIASNSNIMSQGLVMSCFVSSSNNFHIILMFVTWLTSHVKKTLTYPVCEMAVLLGATHFEMINNLTCKRLHNHSSTRVNFFCFINVLFRFHHTNFSLTKHLFYSWILDQVTNQIVFENNAMSFADSTCPVTKRTILFYKPLFQL